MDGRQPMTFPATLTLVTVAVRFDVPPDGGAAGQVLFIRPAPLTGPDPGSIVPPVPQVAFLAADGTASIELPATNDPDWAPVDWAYQVIASVAGTVQYGTLQLDHATPSVQLADLIQWDTAVITPGVSYAPIGHTHESSEHTHVISDVTGLPEELADLQDQIDDKAAVVHGHVIADTTGLQAALDAKLDDVSANLAHLDGGIAVADRFAVSTTGGMDWAAAATPSDLNLYRAAAGLLQTDYAFNAAALRYAGTDVATAIGGLQTALDLKAPLASPTFTGTVSGITKSMVGLDKVDNAYLPTYQPSDQNFLGWSFEPASGVAAATVQPTAGLAQMCRIRVLGSTITNIHFHLTAGGSVLTANQCYAAVYNDAGALLGAGAITASLHSTGVNGWADGGLKTHPLTTPQAVTPGGWYKILWWFNGTTGGTFSRGTNSGSAILNAGLTAATARYATANSGLTTAGTVPANIGTQTGGNTAWWVGVS
jgi:hypothetical protein